MWQVEQPAVCEKIFSPLARSPETAPLFAGSNERTYAMIAHVSESSNPLAGISVPGTPRVMVAKMAASLEP
jgi:hypothetical protein